MRDIYKMHGQHRYYRMHHFEIQKTEQGIVYDIFDASTGKHYVPFRRSKRDGKLYRLRNRTAGYIATEYYKGNITLVEASDPDALKDEPF